MVRNVRSCVDVKYFDTCTQGHREVMKSPRSRRRQGKFQIFFKNYIQSLEDR